MNGSVGTPSARTEKCHETFVKVARVRMNSDSERFFLSFSLKSTHLVSNQLVAILYLCITRIMVFKGMVFKSKYWF